MPCNIDQYGSLKPTRINFSPEAKDLWKAYHDTIEQMLRVGGELSDVRDVASKSADNAARLAALFEVFTNPSSLVISKKSFESAKAIAAWHLSQSVRFFGQFSLSDETHKMVQLDEWLTKYCAQNQISTINKSILMQRGPNSLRKKDLLDQTLKVLVTKNRVRLVSRGKTQLVEVNPALLEASHVVA
jgi:putative DNA primase/helicase